MFYRDHKKPTYTGLVGTDTPDANKERTNMLSNPCPLSNPIVYFLQKP